MVLLGPWVVLFGHELATAIFAPFHLYLSQSSALYFEPKLLSLFTGCYQFYDAFNIDILGEMLGQQIIFLVAGFDAADI